MSYSNKPQSITRAESLKKFIKRHGKGYGGNLPTFDTIGGTVDKPISHDNYEEKPFPKDTKIGSTPQSRRAKRAQEGVSDVRTATAQQIARLKRLGLL